MIHKWKTIIARVAGAAACSVVAWMVVLPRSAQAQTLPPTVLQLDIDNVVVYVQDTFDVSKFATSPNITPAASQPTFSFLTGIGDIVAVNGQAAKGTWTYVFQRVNLTPASAPGRSIADTSRQGLIQANYEILSADGTPIGTIMSLGLGGTGTPPMAWAPRRWQVATSSSTYDARNGRVMVTCDRSGNTHSGWLRNFLM